MEQSETLDNRWNEAQESEKAYWEESFQNEPSFRKMCLSFYSSYKDILSENNINTKDMNIIDIGSGPYGIVSVLDGRIKVALDPLMAYFTEKVPSSFYNDHQIYPCMDKGEEIDFDNESFELVCCLNTLDHAKEPDKIMKESERVLKGNGYFLLTMNHYDKPIVWFRRFLERIGWGDVAHPNTYYLGDILAMISMSGFILKDVKIGDVKESRKKIAEVGGITHVSFKDRIKRAVKLRGWSHVIKQAIASPFHWVFNHLFKTYPDSIFLCKKEVF